MKRHIATVINVKQLIALTIFFILSLGSYAQASISWQDEFDSGEKEKITRWLKSVYETVEKELGPYPFKFILFVHERPNASEPVPWANTVRYERQGVHFYVDPTFSLKEFQEDWTAPHEIAHLSIPYVGGENMWFSEGYATFMQYHLLEFQGIIDEETVKAKCKDRLETICDQFDSTKPFMSLYRSLKSKYDYPAVYWGGACYFFQVNEILKRDHGMSLFDVIQSYQKDGRNSDDSLEEVIESLDRASQTKVFSNMYEKFTTGSARETVYQYASEFD